MKTKPTIYINLHCEEGRGVFQLSLADFTAPERHLLVNLFKEKAVEFAVGKADDGRSVMQFTIGTPIVETVQ